ARVAEEFAQEIQTKEPPNHRLLPCAIYLGDYSAGIVGVRRSKGPAVEQSSHAHRQVRPRICQSRVPGSIAAGEEGPQRRLFRRRLLAPTLGVSLRFGAGDPVATNEAIGRHEKPGLPNDPIQATADGDLCRAIYCVGFRAYVSTDGLLGFLSRASVWNGESKFRRLVG